MKIGQLEISISGKWTLEERITVATVLLGAMEKDIYRGTYSVVGRPNTTSILHVLHEDAEILNAHHNDLEIMLATIAREYDQDKIQ